MPHIKAKRIENIKLPSTVGEFRYNWLATPLQEGESSLVDVSYKDKHFLLELKPKSDSILIKPDKTTRISPTSVMKEALRGFLQTADVEVISDNLAQKKDHAKKAEPHLKPIDFFIDSFPTDKEVWIEVGFGSGRHLLYQAKSNPDILFIGIEIHKPSIEQLLKQIALQKIENILVVDYDARLFLEFVPSNIVGKIFVHFPVPWDKKPHRRVISSAFIQEAKRVLKKGGVLELRTDSENYFRYSFDLFMQEPKAEMEVTKNIEPPISSKYEDRWVRLGKDIYDIRFVSLENSPPLERNFDFFFTNIQFNGNILAKLDTKPMVFEDYFIHFEKTYRIDNKRYLIKLSFGSFDRPEHKYLLMGPEGIRYYPTLPVLSRANIKAHKKLEEIFHG